MDNHTFYILFGEALTYPDRDAYVSDWATSSLLVGPEAEIPAGLIEQLGKIWDVAHMSVSEIRAKTGLSQVKFAERFCIPRRTVEGWETKGSCPDYVRLMMAELLGVFARD